MRTQSLAALALLLAAAPLAAQTPASGGAFVFTLGRDTVAVESYTMVGDTLRGTNVIRVPRTVVRRYEITMAPNGQVQGFHIEAGPPGAPPRSELTLAYPGDSVVAVQRRDTLSRRMAAAVPGHPLLFFEDLVAPWAVALRDAKPPKVTFFDGRGAMDVSLQKSGNTLTLKQPEWGTLTVRMQGGRLLGMDMTGTTTKYIVARVPSVDVDARAAAWAQKDQAGQALGSLSPRDSASATVAGANVVIDYGRPSARGRKVFGGIVPFGQVWRTGANAATQLMTDKDLQIGDVTVPAGTYSLWTIPSAAGWTLIVNKQHGQWGTEYDAAQDLARIPVAAKPLPQPVEQFTISIIPSENGGTIEMAWEGTQATIPFTVK